MISKALPMFAIGGGIALSAVGSMLQPTDPHSSVVPSRLLMLGGTVLGIVGAGMSVPASWRAGHGAFAATLAAGILGPAAVADAISGVRLLQRD